MGNRHGQPERGTNDRTTLCPPKDPAGRKISSVSAASAPYSSTRSAVPSKNDKSPSLSETDSIKRRQKFSVGECNAPAPDAFSHRQMSRKHFSQPKTDHKSLQLTDSEKLCLQQSWNSLISHHPSFVFEVWSAAIDRSPSIKATFVQYAKKKFRHGRSDRDQDEQSELLRQKTTDPDPDPDDGTETDTDETRFRALTKTIHKFFHQLIMVDQLDYNLMKSTCSSLGSRHRSYSQHGYQPVFFDIFIVCFLDRLELLQEEVRLEFPPLKQADAAVNDYWKVMTNSSMVDTDSKEDINKKAMTAWQKFMRMVVDMMRDGYIKLENPTPSSDVEVVITGSTP